MPFADEGEVAPHDPLPIPFTPHVFTDQGERKKLRRIYITYARFRKIGPTPGCSACDNDKSNHNAECIARFEKAFGRESKAPETPVPKEFLSYEELMLPRPPARGEGGHLSDYEPSEVGAEEAPAVPATFRHQKPDALELFEVVSHSGSRLTNISNESGVRVVSIPCDQFDFADPSVIDQLFSQVSAFPGCCLCGSLSAMVGDLGILVTFVGRRIEYFEFSSSRVGRHREWWRGRAGMATGCILLDVARSASI